MTIWTIIYEVMFIIANFVAVGILYNTMTFAFGPYDAANINDIVCKMYPSKWIRVLLIGAGGLYGSITAAGLIVVFKVFDRLKIVRIK